MNPYTVSLVTRSDVEMPDAYDDNSNNNHISDSEGSDYFEEDDTRERILNWTFTASSMALQGARFQLCLHHLREALNRQENRYIEFQVHRLIPMVFELNDDDPVNISHDEFRNLDFRLRQVRLLRGEGPLQGINNGFDVMLETADGMHAVRVQLPIYARPRDGFRALVDAPAGPAIVVKYMGFLNFRGQCARSAYGNIVRDFFVHPHL